MFICGNCKSPSKPGEPITKITVETRERTYPRRKNERGDVIDNGGNGFETVKEINV
jgi:hypothetical protein